MIGKTLGPYEILGKLGQGGMGEVYRARDTKLGREVAIKVLPREMSADPERIARFQREARTLATLQHPNVASVYGFEELPEAQFLVMELVEGEDLADRISRGAIPQSEAIEIALQMSQGLDAAHERGIVHRDLKPANVKLAADGQVKILDFGLARAYAGPEEFDGDPSTSPTITAAMTQAGTILGTAAYMSPEQARGKNVDKRADIWAFGVVLHEMLSGRRAFEGETISDTLAAVLRAEPDRAKLPDKLPRPLTTLIDRCLEKSPRRRLRDIGEAVVLLEDLREGRVQAEANTQVAGNARPLWIAAVVAALVLGAAATWFLRSAPPEPPLRKVTLDLQNPEAWGPVISPNGRHLVFVDDEHLAILDFDQLDPRVLGPKPDSNFRPIWSPNGEQIAFVTDQQLVRVPLAGGTTRPICEIGHTSGGAGGFWTRDGRILFTKGIDHVYVVSASGGIPEIYVAVQDSVDGDLHVPILLPDEKSLLLIRHSRVLGPCILSIYRDGEFHDLDSIAPSAYADPVYDPRGYVLAKRDGGVWATPIAIDPPRRTGESFLVAAEASYPSVAEDGSLVYQRGASSPSAALVLIDREGTVLQQLTEFEENQYAFAASPDGRYVALALRGLGGADIFVEDLQRGSRARFATGPTNQNYPVWTRDGRQIIYAGAGQVLVRPADGSADARVLGVGSYPYVAPDGEHLLYSVDSGIDREDIWMRSLEDPSDSTLVLGTAAREWDPSLSPNGDYLLYSSNDNGVREIYLSHFPVGSGRWQVSTAGGTMPQWSTRGDKIYYVGSAENFYEVEVELGVEPRLAAPKLLFSLAELGFQTWGRYYIRAANEPDRFLALKLANERREVDVIMVENWLREFEAQR